jgi:tetratricopeptide (TPR) repeat protein
MDRLLRYWLIASAATGLRAQTPSSLAALRLAAQRDSNDALAHYQLALGFMDQRWGDSAVRELRTAVAIDPQYAQAYALLGRLLLQAEFQEIVVAGSVLSKIRDLDIGTPTARAMLRRAFLLDPLVGYGRPSNDAFPLYWRGTLERAFRHVDKKQYDLALRDFAEVIHRTSSDSRRIPPIALWYHALTALQLGLVDSAIVDAELLLDRALRLEAEAPAGTLPILSPEFEYVLAHLHQRAGHLREAKRLYLRILEQNFGVYTAHMELARIHEAEGRWDEAIAERRSAVDVNPEDPSLELDLAVTLANAGRDSLALEALRSAVSMNPRESRASYVLGIVAARTHRNDEAHAAFERFLALAPSRLATEIADARARLAQLPQ